LRTLLPILSLLAFAAGCADEPTQEGRRPESSGSSAQDRIDRLRSIGYAEVSEEAHGAEELGVQHFEEKRSAPGYNLHTNRFTCSVVLMDARGRELNRWERPRDRSWSNCQLLADGDLIVIGQEESTPYLGAIDEHRYLTRLSWEGAERWRADVNAHHDFHLFEDGRLAVLSFRRNTEAQDDVVLREDSVHLLSASGEVLEFRSLYEVLGSDSAIHAMTEVEPVEKADLRYQDLIHANSIEFLRQPEEAEANPLFDPGHVLVSSRHQDVVFVFDWESAELLWAWGPGELMGPHDATLLPNGHFLIFDNGLGRGWSRVVELDPVTKEIVWQFFSESRGDFYSASRGSSQRLANGNTLIAESDRSRAFEVTPGGRIVWYWRNTERNDLGQLVTIVRMKRLPLDFVDAILAGR